MRVGTLVQYRAFSSVQEPLETMFMAFPVPRRNDEVRQMLSNCLRDQPTEGGHRLGIPAYYHSLAVHGDEGISSCVNDGPVEFLTPKQCLLSDSAARGLLL